MTALSFEDLIKYDGNPPEKALPRQKGVQVRYGYYQRSFRKNGTSLGQYIVNCIFNNYKDDRFIITVNSFPYLVTEDVAHLVVWENPLYDVTENEIRTYISEQSPNDEFVMYRNKEKHQSIASIKHWQLFVKRSLCEKLKIVSFGQRQQSPNTETTKM